MAWYLVFLVGFEGVPPGPSLERRQAPRGMYGIIVSYHGHVTCRTAGFGAGTSTRPVGPYKAARQPFDGLPLGPCSNYLINKILINIIINSFKFQALKHRPYHLGFRFQGLCLGYTLQPMAPVPKRHAQGWERAGRRPGRACSPWRSCRPGGRVHACMGGVRSGTPTWVHHPHHAKPTTRDEVSPSCLGRLGRAAPRRTAL